MPLSNNIKTTIVNYIARGSDPSKMDLYVGLCTTTGTSAAPGTEVAYTNYHRMMLSNSSSQSGHLDNKMSAATLLEDGKTVESHNNLPVMFFKNPENGVAFTVVSVAFWTAENKGTYVGYSNLQTPVTVNPGEIANFDVNELKLSLTDEEVTD